MNEEKYENEYEEEIEEVEDTETESSGGGLIKFLIGAAVGVGGCAAYKYVVKPIRNKIKAKKAEKAAVVQATEATNSDVIEADYVDEENS